MTVQEAIAAAEKLLPGDAAPDGEIDPRWRAIIVVGEFIEDDPEAVWSFILRWGSSPDEDLRTAIATGERVGKRTGPVPAANSASFASRLRPVFL
jgi:hypothetical protein